MGGTTRYEVMSPPRMTITQRPREALVGDLSVLIGREYVTRISTLLGFVRELDRSSRDRAGDFSTQCDSRNSVR